MTQKIIGRACADSDIDLNSNNTGVDECMKQMTVILLGSSDHAHKETSEKEDNDNDRRL